MNSPFAKPLALTPLLAALLCAAGLSPAYAATATESSSKATQTAEESNVTRATLANGLQVVVVRDTLAPMVSTRIVYRTGGYQSPENSPGTAHAVEHMLFRDSKGLTDAQFAEMGGKMGARHNAVTTADLTQYYFNAPSQYVDLLLQIEATRMRGALMDQTQWQAERGAMEQEISRNISRPETLAMAEARKLLFAGTGYAQSPVGSRETLGKTSSADLRAFYDRWYQPNNALLVVAGDVDPKAVLTKVEQLFGAIPRGKVPAQTPIALQPVKPATITRSAPAAMGMVRFMHRIPGERSPDYPAVRMLVQVLNNARSSLAALGTSGKAYSVGAGASAFLQAGLGSVTATYGKDKDPAAIAAELNRVIEDVRKHGVPAELVDAVKRRERADFEFAKNSAANIAGAWSEALAMGGVDSPQQALDKLLAVTPEDVARVAREYFGPEQRITVIMTPDSKGSRPVDGVASVDKAETDAGDDAEADTVDQAESGDDGDTIAAAGDDDRASVERGTPLPEWAAKPLADLRLPNWTLDPVTMRLDNGITLIVQPETISKTVVVHGLIDNSPDLQVAKEQKGVEWLLDDLLRDGTRTMDRNAFRTAQDAIAARVKAGRSFALAVPSEHFGRGLQLLAENLLQPALPEAAFQRKQRSLARAVVGNMETPDYRRKRATREGLLPAGDPDLIEATSETISGLSLADVKAYHARVFRPDMTTLVVVGDVTPAQAKAEVEKWFGQWQAKGPKPEVVLPPVPLNPASFTHVDNPYAAQDRVYMAQTLDVRTHDPERYALQLGNLVLGGNGFASRLMQDIRVKHGYAYGVSSTLNIDRARSHFFIKYGSDPDKVAAVDALLQENLQRMRSTPVSEEELLKAKQAAIRSIPMGVGSINSIASSLLYWSTRGEPLNKSMIAAQHFLDLSAEDVRAAFEKHIRPDRLVQVVIGPAPVGHPKLAATASTQGD